MNFSRFVKTSFAKIVELSHYQTANRVNNLALILSVGDTTFLDYQKIKIKREEYGPIGNGGNGLILHSSLAVDPNSGQPLGLLWSKLWKREHKIKTQKKRKKSKGFEKKESYKWVEAIKKVPEVLEKVSSNNDQKVLHVFDREGDISEVFEEAQKHENCGVLIRAAHNRSLSESEDYLWDYVEKQPVQFKQEIELPKNHQRKKRTVTLAIKFYPVKLRSPQRLLRMTYLNRTQPDSSAETILTPLQIKVLTALSSQTKTKSKSEPELGTIAWAIHEIARLGGYLEHRKKTPIGITVLWRGLLELISLCEGWELRENFAIK